MPPNLTPEAPSPQPPAPETPGAELKESPEVRETQREQEPRPTPAEKPPVEEKAPAAVPAVVAVVPDKPAPPLKDEYHIRVERVLEDGLVDEYLALSPDARQRFKQEGERVATRIREMMDRSKVKVKEVLTLILGWLRIIPKPNKWFLEQEAKIKTDRVMALVDEKRNEASGL